MEVVEPISLPSVVHAFLACADLQNTSLRTVREHVQTQLQWSDEQTRQHKAEIRAVVEAYFEAHPIDDAAAEPEPRARKISRRGKHKRRIPSQGDLYLKQLKLLARIVGGVSMRGIAALSIEAATERVEAALRERSIDYSPSALTRDGLQAARWRREVEELEAANLSVSERPRRACAIRTDDIVAYEMAKEWDANHDSELEDVDDDEMPELEAVEDEYVPEEQDDEQ